MDYQNALIGCLKEQNSPLQQHTLTNGDSVWVRKSRHANPRIYYVLLNILSKYLLRAPILQSVYTHPKQAIIDEANRLKSLEKAQINAPKLLALHPDGLMMSDIAQGKTIQTIADKLEQLQQQQISCLKTWCETANALFTLHQKQQYLAQAFVRNIILIDQQYFFIDFEEDPHRIFTLEECQVRDCLLFLHSSAYHLNTDTPQALSFWQQHINNRPIAFQKTWQQTIQKIAWTKHLHIIQHLGRDGYRVAKALQFINACYSKATT